MASKKKRTTQPEASPWRRLLVDVQASVADTISGLLLDEGALGLETEDDETRAVPGRAMMPTGRSSIIATFSRADGLEGRVAARIAKFTQYVDKARDAVLEWSDLWPEDWDAIFKAQWKPFRIGRRVWIVPSWERPHFHVERVGPGPAPVALYLDPGMAFGTGTHETTRLCCEAIEELVDGGGTIERLLDVGTGTGILGILALQVGAKTCKGTDIDPVAVKAALDNARDNGVGARFSANDDMPDAEGQRFDGVIANILAGTLIELAQPIVGSVAPKGRLWLSGVLSEQEPAVVDAYKARGMVHVGTKTMNGWVRIDLRKP